MTADLSDEKQELRRIGSNVRYLRQEKGMTQAGLSEAMQAAGQVNWYQTTVSRVERGLQPLNGAEMLALRRVLGEGLVFGTGTDQVIRMVGTSVLSKAVKHRLAYLEEGLSELQKVVSELRELVGDEAANGEHPEEA